MRMRFRWGVMLGFGVGYVLGSKAGRERYEQLRNAWASLRPAVTQLGEAASAGVNTVEQRIEHLRHRKDSGDAGKGAGEYANLTGSDRNI